ncbi:MULTISPECIES: DUF418 domain-containing protein [Nocardiopsis]|uniref:DUF418 domain-containing protein n=1 Tax=Nocardiopsis sinuspersici TaxID=501010 RepID=A0A1V3C212_9ACTN|nr:MULTISPECIES: DUF418 domain-containing protein [Nocardiopsis]OOC54688.1 hypothetical protein NOSIN_13465 [Nocardiopsis sinuspersici]
MPGHAVARGPAGAGERALAPDLARGSMLLFIAIANTAWYLWAVPMSGMSAHPEPAGALDAVAQFFTVMAVDSRSYPMFAFLFGYGMVQLARRQEAAGTSARDVDALLRRRNLWLLVFGFVHALLLWMGDVLGAYGLAGLVLGWLFLRRADRTLLVWAGAITGLMLLLSAFSLVGLAFTPADGAASPAPGLEQLAANIGEPSLWGAALGRLTAWPLVVLGQGLLGLAVPTAILLGYWAARHRILEEPGNNLALLRLTAFAGVTVGWLGGLPSALAQVGVWELSPTQASMLSMPHMVTGLACGLGYVSLIALAARRLQERGRGSGPVVEALAATGKRSLSAYLAQSVLCAPVLAAWGLGVGAHLTSWSMFLFAVGVWLVTVVAAHALERAGRRGPAEVLLRRLAYRGPVAGGAREPEEGPVGGRDPKA